MIHDSWFMIDWWWWWWWPWPWLMTHDSMTHDSMTHDSWLMTHDSWLMMIDDWWLMIDDWWLMIDDDWWRWMTMDGDGWWWMMMMDEWWWMMMMDEWWWMMMDDGWWISSACKKRQKLAKRRGDDILLKSTHMYWRGSTGGSLGNWKKTKLWSSNSRFFVFCFKWFPSQFIGFRSIYFCSLWVSQPQS